MSLFNNKTETSSKKQSRSAPDYTTWSPAYQPESGAPDSAVSLRNGVVLKGGTGRSLKYWLSPQKADFRFIPLTGKS
jgi:hypothetical protein